MDEEEKYATGMDDDEELSRAASPAEVKKGNYTRVTRLTADGDIRPDRSPEDRD